MKREEQEEGGEDGEEGARRLSMVEIKPATVTYLMMKKAAKRNSMDNQRSISYPSLHQHTQTHTHTHTHTQ